MVYKNRSGTSSRSAIEACNKYSTSLSQQTYSNGPSPANERSFQGQKKGMSCRAITKGHVETELYSQHVYETGLAGAEATVWSPVNNLN